MQITIDTNALSDLDKSILLMLVVGEDKPEEKPAEKAEPKPAEKAAAKPAKKAAAKPEPEPEPESEPMAEEALPEEPDEDDEDDVSDEDLLSLAVKKATEMVGSGEAPKVREALDSVGVSRVRELNADNVREFFKALS